MSAMREHLSECKRCARRDADIRRALLLVRNLPPLAVATDFDDRLKARLRHERTSAPDAGRTWSRSAVDARAGLAAAVLLAVAIAGLQLRGRTADVPVLQPAVVIAIPAEPLPGHDPASAFVASMSTGIPMWPALMLAEEGPLLFAATELQGSSYSREP